MRWWALIVMLWTGAAHAQPIDVSKLHGQAIGGELLEDASGQLTFEEARARAFVPATRSETSLGFTRSAYWIRLDVANPGDEPQSWLLELGYPHLDHVELYDGAGKHWVTGDMLPFSARPLQHTNFVFPQRTPPNSRQRLYLRVQTGGALRVPLRAWTHDEFVVREHGTHLLLWMYYGAVVLLAWYNFAVALVIRRREHAYYSLLLLVIGGAIFSLSGHTAQYLLPEHPGWANRSLAVSLALAWLSVQFYTRAVVADGGLLAIERKFYRIFTSLAGVAVAIALFAPPDVSTRVVLVMLAIYIPCGFWLRRSVVGRRDTRLKLYQLSWYSYMFTVPVALAAHADWIPPWPIALWAGHLGSVAHGIFTSLALPARINELGARLAGLNQELSANVNDLKLALARAEEATEEAQRAMRVKDEFMATMSHELRTPLNAIINVPQGLLADFPLVHTATCSGCDTRFLLEPDERLDATTACEACGRAGTLREGHGPHYTGDPAHTVRFLRKIERSGKHLLQMVNGVLDFSKMEAGRLELSLAEFDMQALLVEVVDEMTDLAERKQLRVAIEVPADREPSLGDPVRVKQVLLNLLSNAIKFSEPGGLITVRWRHDDEYDLVSVRDQGIGIKAEDQERVFASFEQVHKGATRKYGGTGLGLSISRSLVRMHGGELRVASEFGRGATFTFSLPRTSFARAAS